jgi:hypothetical protein
MLPVRNDHNGSSDDSWKLEDQIMNKTNGPKVSYHIMSILAIIVGGLGILFQFMPGWEFFTFFLCLAVLGGLIGGSSGYAEHERQQLGRSYKKAYEWLLLIVLVTYAVIELLKWFVIANGVVNSLNSHWSGLMIAVMCILMGIAGIQGRSSEDSA